MLVLSRKEGQKIRIGDDILITIVRVSARAIRIGIEAPNNVQIIREELLEEGDESLGDALHNAIKTATNSVESPDLTSKAR